jgi:hypothetical protein
MDMDKVKAKALHTELDEAVRAVAAKHGMDITKSRGAFSDGLFRLNVEIAEDGKSSEASAFTQLAHVYGLRANMLNSLVTLHGQTYRIVGLLPRSTKFPVVVENADGRKLKVTASAIARLAG